MPKRKDIKTILIIGAGGVTSSVLEAFVGTANKIYITSKTKKKVNYSSYK